MMRRRTFLGCGLALATAIAGRDGMARSADGALRIGLTQIFLDDQADFLPRWRSYLEGKLARPVEFVHRGSYHEIVDLLHQEKVDVAWLCGYPYVRNRRGLRLLAVPEYEGRPSYRAYVIVHAADAGSRSLLDLRGRVFAYADPDSDAGYLYPNYRLLAAGEHPDSFFGKTFFTWAHRKVIEAVASRVAHAGAVSGYIWHTLARFHPEITAMTRILERSPEFGFPPLVARASLPTRDGAQVRQALLDMGGDGEGREVLRKLNLTGIGAGDDGLFAEIERMAKLVDGHGDSPAA